MTTSQTIKDKILKIKSTFRLLMNGVASHSMRQKGLEYHLNWGIDFVQLKSIAKDYGKDEPLAIALWKEDIRECKILATLIMPPERMLPELTEIWLEQTLSQEIAEMSAFNLYQHVSYASTLAFQCIADGRDIRQICGYNILSRLFMKGQYPNERSIDEFLDQAHTALQSANIAVRHAAMNSLKRFAQIGEEYEKMVMK